MQVIAGCAATCVLGRALVLPAGRRLLLAMITAAVVVWALRDRRSPAERKYALQMVRTLTDHRLPARHVRTPPMSRSGKSRSPA
jgi:hypothetical protein